MKHLSRVVLIAAVTLFSVCLVACGANSSNNKDAANNNAAKTADASKDMKKVAVDQLKDDMQIIDTRTPDQFIGWKNSEGVSGHIPGAIDFPETWFDYEPDAKIIDIELERRHIDKTKPTVLYGNDDVTEDVYKKFADHGFEDLAVLEGGVNDYDKKGEKTTALEGYTRYVSPQWVSDLLDGKKPESYEGKKYQIVEVALKEEDYKEGHIPGAVYADPNKINQIPGPRMVEEYEGIPMEKQLTFWGFPTDENIKKEIENLGIDEDTTVILYGTEAATTAANRAALVMDYAGVKDIRLLNGGKPLWTLEKRALDTEPVSVEKANFTGDVPQNPDIVFDYDDEMKFIDDDKTVIASVRSWDEYLGKTSGYTYIAEAGDIKNGRFAYAGSDPYSMEDYRNLDNTMFNYEIIKDRWEKWGITGDKRVSWHCGTGWRAAETYYIGKALGWEGDGVYVGGWYEWSKRGGPTKEPGLPKDAPEQKPEQYHYKKK